MRAILSRELRSYYNGFIGFLFAAFILLFVGLYTTVINLRAGYPYFEYVLSNIVFIYLIAVPILTMRTLPEERRQKTDQLLYSLPISMSTVVVAKYLAMVIVLAVPMAVLSMYPLILSIFGMVQFKMTYSAIFAFFLLGASLISIGLFVSSLTDNQSVAAVLTFVVLLMNFMITGLTPFISERAEVSCGAFLVLGLILGIIVVRTLTKSKVAGGIFSGLWAIVLLAVFIRRPDLIEGSFAEFLNALSLFERFNSFLKGVFDWGEVVFFITFIAVALFITIQSMEKRRWIG